MIGHSRPAWTRARQAFRPRHARLRGGDPLHGGGQTCSRPNAVAFASLLRREMHRECRAGCGRSLQRIGEPPKFIPPIRRRISAGRVRQSKSRLGHRVLCNSGGKGRPCWSCSTRLLRVALFTTTSVTMNRWQGTSRTSGACTWSRAPGGGAHAASPHSREDEHGRGDGWIPTLRRGPPRADPALAGAYGYQGINDRLAEHGSRFPIRPPAPPMSGGAVGTSPNWPLPSQWRGETVAREDRDLDYGAPPRAPAALCGRPINKGARRSRQRVERIVKIACSSIASARSRSPKVARRIDLMADIFAESGRHARSGGRRGGAAARRRVEMMRSGRPAD